jgi:hypothetical protein
MHTEKMNISSDPEAKKNLEPGTSAGDTKTASHEETDSEADASPYSTSADVNHQWSNSSPAELKAHIVHNGGCPNKTTHLSHAKGLAERLCSINFIASTTTGSPHVYQKAQESATMSQVIT